MKFSGSLRAVGARRARASIPVRRTRNPTRSLNEKYVWNGALSKLLSRPVGLFDPV